MAREQSPAYQWYVKEWRSSRAVQRMSFSERGVYREMLDEQWENLSLPDDANEVAHIIACTPAQEAEVIAAWPAVRRKFASMEGSPGRIRNLSLERFRKERRAFKRDKSLAGKSSAAAAVRGPAGTFQQRTNSRPTDHQQPPSADQQPVPTAIQPASASASATALASATAVDRRSKRPIFTGQRVKVFEWMFDDLCGLLGPHADDFNLHEWFFALEARCVQDGTVPPDRDGGAWLKAETLKEAQRRGLPLKVATVEPGVPGNKRIAGLVAGTQAFLDRRAR